MQATQSWTDQLRASDAHEVKPVDKDKAGIRAGQPMLYPSAQMIDRYVRDIPEGEGRDLKVLRRELAARHGALATCPVTTRKALHIVAEAAYEQVEDGAAMDEVTPVWRVIDEGSGTLLKKLSFDSAFIFDQRAAEGL